MYELLYTWSDGELSNDTAPDFPGVIDRMELEEKAMSNGGEEYEGVYPTEVIVRYLPD